jgi:ribosomal protein S18 acetylase RimI-like enzyme
MPSATSRFRIRPAHPADAARIASIFALHASGLREAPVAPGAFETLIQTGSAFIVAERDAEPVGAVRIRYDEGIAWLDLLVASHTGAGPALLRAAEHAAQDRGIRLVRMEVPEGSRLPSAFSRFGYLPVARSNAEGTPMLVLEKRLPLLTVREQRRSDAADIARLTGEDPWPFEQGVRPGWFVLADGERVAGAISVRIGPSGSATASVHALDEAYCGRELESWMLERAAMYAATNGALTITVEARPELAAQRRTLEDFRWEFDGSRWQKRLAELPPDD